MLLKFCGEQESGSLDSGECNMLNMPVPISAARVCVDCAGTFAYVCKSSCFWISEA